MKIALFIIALAVFLLGYLMKLRFKKALEIRGLNDDETKKANEFIENGNFTMVMGALFWGFALFNYMNMILGSVLTITAIVFYAMAFLLHRLTGASYKKIVKVELIAIVVMGSATFASLFAGKPDIKVEGGMMKVDKNTLVEMDQIKEISLQKDQIQIEEKLSGIELLGYKNGQYVLKGGEEVYLRLQKYDGPPYITIEMKDGSKLYTNYGDQEKTVEQYDKIKK